MADKTTTWGIKIPVDTNADTSASSVDKLRSSIAASQEAVKQYGATLRNLRGTSDEVKAAKEQLKSAMNAERDAISRATLALGKHGTTVGDSAKKMKEHTAASEVAKGALSATAPAVDGLVGKFQAMQKLLGTNSAGSAALAVGMLAVAAAMVAAGKAIADATISLVKWAFESANELRTMGLLREAASGGAENASALGHQIDALGSKVPQTRKELNDLAVTITRSMAGTRVTGQGVVDTFNAVAQASAAMGDTAGGKIQEIIDRSKTWGRVSIGLNELQGTGIAREDVAHQLAKNLNIGFKDAQRQLAFGLTNVNAGAAAIRQVVEAKFGKLNLRQMLDLNVMSKKFKDTLANLTSGINLDPLLEGIQKLMGFFDTGTVTGAALKNLITDMGSALTAAFKVGAPFAQKFFEQLIIEALKFEILLLRVAVYVKETFGVNIGKVFDDTTVAITAAKVAFELFAIPLVFIGAQFVILGTVIFGVLKAIQIIGDTFTQAYNRVKEMGWGELGKMIVMGMVIGITDALVALWGVLATMGEGIKNAVKNALGIHSPSRVFEEYGNMTAEGFGRGVAANDAPARAVGAMVPSVAPVSKGGGGNNITVSVTLSFPNVKSGSDLQSTIASPSFKAALTRAIEETMTGIAVPTQTEAA